MYVWVTGRAFNSNRSFLFSVETHFFSESSTISLPSPPKTMFLLPLLPLLLSRTAPCQIV